MKDLYMIVMFALGTVVIALAMSILFIGCSCVKSDKALTIDCDKCKVQYNHDRDYINIKEN